MHRKHLYVREEIPLKTIQAMGIVHKNRVPAFTLLELIITITIVSIVVVSLFSAFQTGITSYRRVEKVSDVYQTARAVFETIERDVKNSFLYTKDDTRFKGGSHTLDFFTVADIYNNGVTVTMPSRVTYTIDNETLVRNSRYSVDAFKDTSEGESGTLAFNVKDISFQYAFPTSNPDSPYDWQDAWPNDDSQKNQMPLAVKIKLVLIEKEKNQARSIEFSSICGLPQL